MILSIHDLSFRYKSKEALSHLHFALQEHEVVAILGPNGAGKTTLIKCINGILKPQKGTILIDNEDISRLSRLDIARKTGYVSQHNETARLTAFDAILLGRYPYIRLKVTEKDLRKTEGIIEKLHLQQLRLRYIDEMSGGELQKICIARALVREPTLLLLDEPTNSLDLRNQIEILSLIREITRGHQVSAIMTMHDINLAIHYADRFLFLKDGCIFAACRQNEITRKIIEDVYKVAVSMEYYKGVPVIIPAQYT